MRELAALQRSLGWTAGQLRTPAVRQNEGPGNALLATLVYQHVSEVITGFGEKGVSAEHVDSIVAREVTAFQASDCALGPHLADQWMLPLALAIAAQGGTASFTCSEMTEHATTNIGVIERFLAVRFGAKPSGSGWRVGLAGHGPRLTRVGGAQ